MSTTPEELGKILALQIESRWGAASLRDLSRVVDEAVLRMEAALSRIILPGYTRNGEAYFNHMHGDQSAMWYYLLANTAYGHGRVDLAERFFLLNKAFNGIICMYDTLLPEVFVLIHTVGAVLGKATYGNYFVAYQNVTVGTNVGAAPTIGAFNVLFGGSMILGKCVLGDRVIVSANSTLIDLAVPADSVVAGSGPSQLVKPRKRDFAREYFSL